MNEIIAERRLLYGKKNSVERIPLAIRVGRPYWLQPDVAACPLEWDGLFGALPDVQGADLLQALYLAADVEPMIKAQSKRYDFFFADGEPYFDSD